MSLKNPFAMRNGKIVTISDISADERGQKCNCICPLCHAHFLAKIGDERQSHFAHDGKPCDSVAAIMTSLYQLMFEALQENPCFTYPACYGYYEGVSSNRKASMDDIKNASRFSPDKEPYDDICECIVAAGRIQITQTVLHKNGNGIPDALILTCQPHHELALVLEPPSTLCKISNSKQFKDLPTVAIKFPENLYELRSALLKTDLCRLSVGKRWICNPHIDEWLRSKLKNQNHDFQEYQARRKQKSHFSQPSITREEQNLPAGNNPVASVKPFNGDEKEVYLQKFSQWLKKTYPQLPDKPLPDNHGNTWYFCMLCQNWFPAEKMAAYGGSEAGCRGTCSMCARTTIWHPRGK